MAHRYPNDQAIQCRILWGETQPVGGLMLKKIEPRINTNPHE